MKSLRCIQIFLPETERFEYPFRNNERSFKPHQLVIIFAYLVYTETNETTECNKEFIYFMVRFRFKRAEYHEKNVRPHRK